MLPCSAVVRFVAFLVCFLAIVGCGGGRDTPPLGRVSGKILLNGQPLNEGEIRFQPKSGGRDSFAKISEDGTYKLIYSMDEFGAKVDTHRVVILTDRMGGGNERVPAQYNHATELEREVKSGSNLLNFELEGAPPKKSGKGNK